MFFGSSPEPLPQEIWSPISHNMSQFCPHCLSLAQTSPRCSSCTGKVLSHPELFDLSIAHIDADAFYASVEKHDDPSIAERPLIVGGAGARSVVTTACYIARQYGVRSAQPMYKARQACPDAIIRSPNFPRYREVSGAILAMMKELTPLVQSVSLDEAYLDMSGTTQLHGAPPAVMLARLAKRVREEIGITVSIGLSHARYLAKIASDLEKPSGFSVIGRAETIEFLHDKPVGIIGGVGPEMQKSLAALGIITIGDIRRADPALLRSKLGSYAPQLVEFAFGRDNRPVAPSPAAKSISAETTFTKDRYLLSDLEAAIWPLCEKVSSRAKKASSVGETVTLKLKTDTHRQITRQVQLDHPTQLAEEIYRSAQALLAKAAGKTSYRLVGIGLSGLQDASNITVQQKLFDDGAARREAAERALDAIREKFGDDAAYKGRSFR